MTVGLWAEIRRLKEIVKLSNRAIAVRLRCCVKTVRKALAMKDPPQTADAATSGLVLPFRPRIDALIEKYPELSAVRVREEIANGPEGYKGSVYPLRRYLRGIRPHRGRIYQEALYAPGEALQVDWGTCGRVRVGDTVRRVYAFIAVLCYSRLCFLKFSLSQSAPCFYRAIVEALNFFGGLTKKIIFDNLKAAVLDGHGRTARLNPGFLALCGHYCLEPIACQRDDPETKGVVECSVRYVKGNALQGRDETLQTWDGYLQLAPYWRDQIANPRVHETTGEKPIDRFQKEKPALRPLPDFPFDTDDDRPTVVSNHCRVRFDANRYSVPPAFASKTVALRANDRSVWVLFDGKEIARHARCYQKRQILCLPEHRLAALQRRHRARASQIESEFDAFGPEARAFHLKLLCDLSHISHRSGRLFQGFQQLLDFFGRNGFFAALAENPLTPEAPPQPTQCVLKARVPFLCIPRGALDMRFAMGVEQIPCPYHGIQP